jgi:hypothetical protein
MEQLPESIGSSGDIFKKFAPVTNLEATFPTACKEQNFRRKKSNKQLVVSVNNISSSLT